ncbi:hypothetical protein D3C72_2048290 [compost metagenome]
MWRSPRSLDQSDRFTSGGASTHHIVNDQHTASNGGTHKRATFSMVFSFLTVVGKWHVTPQARQFHGHRGGQRDTFVGRAKDHIKLHTADHDGFCIKFRQTGHLGTVIEQASVKEIRA